MNERLGPIFRAEPFRLRRLVRSISGVVLMRIDLVGELLKDVSAFLDFGLGPGAIVRPE